MTVQEAADKKIDKVRRSSWPVGKYIELTFDHHSNLSAWGMLVEVGEPKRRIDTVGLNQEDYEAVK